MTTFEKIVNAIKDFDLPYAPDLYTGTSSTGWFTYNYADDYGADYADDAPGAVVVSVQVHLLLPVKKNFIALKNQVRKSIFEQGFTFPQITILIEDNKWRHIIYECDTIEEDAL